MGAWKGDHKPPVRTACHGPVFELGYIEHRVYRKEGILILSGGATIHNLGQMESPENAGLPFHQFNDAVTFAISVSDVSFLQKCRPTHA